jgi:hypothetical protein
LFERSVFYRAVLAVMLIAGTDACTAGAAVSRPAQTVEVVRNSGLKQCGDETPSPDPYAKLLQANGVKVFSSSCATDGAMRPQVCGADRGLFYVYEIDPAALPKALELGFADLQQHPSASRFHKFPCTTPAQQGGASTQR